MVRDCDRLGCRGTTPPESVTRPIVPSATPAGATKIPLGFLDLYIRLVGEASPADTN